MPSLQIISLTLPAQASMNCLPAGTGGSRCGRRHRHATRHASMASSASDTTTMATMMATFTCRQQVLRSEQGFVNSNLRELQGFAERQSLTTSC